MNIIIFSSKLTKSWSYSLNLLFLVKSIMAEGGEGGIEIGHY